MLTPTQNRVDVECERGVFVITQLQWGIGKPRESPNAGLEWTGLEYWNDL